jgi:GT2 family glycosyltransferase
MPPIAKGETDFITGNNTSYKRSLIEKVNESLLKNYWEYFLQRELKQAGVKFYSVPALIINHKKEFGFFYFLLQRFHYSRSFAAMRKRKSSVPKQILHLLYTPVLPFHQTWLIFQNVRQKKRNRREFFLSLPLLLIFMGSYALGEFAGQVFGSGDSLLKVE